MMMSLKIYPQWRVPEATEIAKKKGVFKAAKLRLLIEEEDIIFFLSAFCPYHFIVFFPELHHERRWRSKALVIQRKLTLALSLKLQHGEEGSE